MITSSQTTPRCRVAQLFAIVQMHMSTHLRIIDIVNFVEDDKLDITDEVGSLVEHAAQNFRGHNEAACLRVDLDVAR